MPSESVEGSAGGAGQTKTLRYLNILSIALVMLALGFAAFNLVAPVHYAMLVAMGRSPNCPLAAAVRSGEAVKSLNDNRRRMEDACRVIRKDPEGMWLWDTPKGEFWVPEGFGGALATILAEQLENFYGSGPSAVRAGDIVLDCGAHVGLFTREALDAGAELVVAIEPSPRTREALRRNFTAEIAAGRVILYEKGVWDRDEVLPFVTHQEHAVDHVALEAEGDTEGVVDVIHVRLTTIDKLVAELGLERVDFIKMDIEGAEQKALKGAQATLKKYKPRLALAAYHVLDDQYRIPELVLAARPDYTMTCGLCGERDLRIDAQTLMFY